MKKILVKDHYANTKEWVDTPSELDDLKFKWQRASCESLYEYLVKRNIDPHDKDILKGYYLKVGDLTNQFLDVRRNAEVAVVAYNMYFAYKELGETEELEKDYRRYMKMTSEARLRKELEDQDTVKFLEDVCGSKYNPNNLDKFCCDYATEGTLEHTILNILPSNEVSRDDYNNAIASVCLSMLDDIDDAVRYMRGN